MKTNYVVKTHFGGDTIGAPTQSMLLYSGGSWHRALFAVLAAKRQKKLHISLDITRSY